MLLYEEVIILESLMNRLSQPHIILLSNSKTENTWFPKHIASNLKVMWYNLNSETRKNPLVFP
jgi:hypothetical protein